MKALGGAGPLPPHTPPYFPKSCTSLPGDLAGKGLDPTVKVLHGLRKQMPTPGIPDVHRAVDDAPHQPRQEWLQLGGQPRQC